VRLEQRARHVAVAAHRAVVTIEAARIRHEDAQQCCSTSAAGAHSSKIQRTKRADVVRMTQARRQRRRHGRTGFTVVAGEGHQ